jgi:hypothetical protein
MLPSCFLGALSYTLRLVATGEALLIYAQIPPIVIMILEVQSLES